MRTSPFQDLLRPETRQLVDSIGQADLVVGIPSFNNCATIGHVVRAAAAGLAKYFPEHRAILVNSDGGSSDGTPDVVATADLGRAAAVVVRREARLPARVVTAYQGLPGKGSAFRTIFEIARRVGARACAVVDSDLRSITPEWFELLLGPVLHGDCEFVAPLYSRHKYDGTITNSIVHPVVRSLYGVRIRQPIGGDFGFSGRLAAHFLEHDVWDTDVARFGIDIWMTTTALVGGFRVGQSYLGAKIHDAKDPGAHLSAMLTQVAGSLFGQLGAHEAFWRSTTESIEPPRFGFEYEVGLEPVHVHLSRLVHACRQGVAEFDGLYARFLTPGTRAALAGLADERVAEDAFHMPADLWVRVVYEFAAAHHGRRLPPEHLLPTLTPLYLGRTASWINEARDYNANDVEVALDALCRRFEEARPYLLERWMEGRAD